MERVCEEHQPIKHFLQVLQQNKTNDHLDPNLTKSEQKMIENDSLDELKKMVSRKNDISPGIWSKNAKFTPSS